MMESKLVMKSMEVLMPKIKLNKKILIPMVDTQITRDNVSSLKPFKYD